MAVVGVAQKESRLYSQYIPLYFFKSMVPWGGDDGKRSKAFVTGGGGYVGQKLCEELVRRGYQVTAFDVHFLDESDIPGLSRVKVLM